MSAQRIEFEELRCGGPSAGNVLFVTNMWPDELRPYYGSFIASQARSLAAAGMEVDVLYVRGFLGGRSYLQALGAIPRAARRRSYEVTHVHYGHTAAVSLGLPPGPLVTSFCGEDLLGAPRENGVTLKSRIEVAVFRQIARRADVTITKSKEMERVLPQSIQEHNRVLPNGVDLDTFKPEPKQEARARLGWDPEAPTILFLGNPEDPRKNVALAEAAELRVRERVGGARLHVAWGVDPAQVPVLMNAADCLVFPSKSEGSPNAVKEAMACALPIVASPVGDIAERFDGVDNCFVRDPEPEAFASALVRALEGGRAPAARRAVEALGVGAVADRLMQIYDEAKRLRAAKR